MKQIFNLMTRLLAVVGIVSFVAVAGGQTFTVLKSFNPHINATGQHPVGTLAQGPDGTLYGVTSDGGAGAAGTVFRVQTNGGAFSVIKSFQLVNAATGTNADGATPEAGLVLSGGILYGTTSAGGSGGSGTVFSLGTNGNNFTVLKQFSAMTAYTNSDGANPMAALIVSNGVLFGCAANGGALGQGTLFRLNTNGTGFTNIYTFTGGSDGTTPAGRLLLSGNTLYGTASSGGDNGGGTLFSLATDGTGFTPLHGFTGSGTDGSSPEAGLVLVGTQLFGTTALGDSGDNSDDGTVFRVDINGNNFTNLYSFTDSIGFRPGTELTVSGSTLYGTTGNGGVSPFGIIFKINTDGSSFATVISFDYLHGWGPTGGVVLSGGMLYGVTGLGGAGNSGLGNGVVYSLDAGGFNLTALVVFGDFTGAADPDTGLTLNGNTLAGTTLNGGDAGNGTVFEIGTNGGGYTQAHEFTITDSSGDNQDGANPRSALALSGGVFYGTTRYGGTNGWGTIFKINADGSGFTNLYTFPSPYLGLPISALTVSGGTIYGMTPGIGTSSGYGTVFKLSTNGTGFTNIYSFNGTDGNGPTAGLTLSGNTLYGATQGGGSGNGNIFQVNTDGTHYTNIYSFTGGTDGAGPGTVLFLTNGVLYGTTYHGGTNGGGTIFKINTDKSGFTVLHTFDGTAGSAAAGDLLLSGSTLYGTAAYSGTSNAGSIFQLDTSGNNFTVLKNFTGGADGALPTTTLVLLNNTLYGTTESGGASGHGTIFSLSLSSVLVPIPLNISLVRSNAVALTWGNPAFALQAAPLVTGTYTNVPAANSPFTNVISGAMQYFRLRATN